MIKFLEKYSGGSSMVKKKNREEEEEDNKIICEQCGSTDVILNTIYITCTRCSYVLKKYKTNDINTEVSLLPNMKTRTSVCGNGKQARDMQRLYTYMWIPTDERSIHNVYKEIYNVVSKHLNLINRHDTQKRTANTLSMKTAILYRELIRCDKVHRNPLKKGILAKCFYYKSKENYIILTKKELAKIFEIDVKYVTKGNNIINKTCRANKEFRKLVNRSPITLIDMISKIDHKFPTITEIDIERLKRITKRIKDLSISLNNTPRPIISGLLLNYAIYYGMTDTINSSTIEDKLSVSSSSINKYSSMLSHVIYNYNTRYYISK